MNNAGYFPLALAIVGLVAMAAKAHASESWSALAVSSEAFGTAKGAGSQAEAEKQAMAACNFRSRTDACEVRAFTARQCGAVASWSYRDKSYRQFGNLASFGETMAQARARAMDDCRRRHRGCRVAIALCNG